MNQPEIFIGRPDLDVHEGRHYDTIVHAGTNIAHDDFKASPGRWILTPEEKKQGEDNIKKLQVNTSHPDAWRVECAIRITSQYLQ